MNVRKQTRKLDEGVAEFTCDLASLRGSDA